MRTINELRDICQRFENGDFDLKELQGRFNRVAITEPDLFKLSELLFKMDNNLEQIIYTKLENHHRQNGLQAVQEFLKKLNDIAGNS